jgi:hypothetical protein
MTVYSIVLFLHLASVLGLFATDSPIEYKR